MADQSPEKIGLALSGGGLRASFFHIGILAQMAEQGLLRSIQVISCVSGGSIIGALYYLHVKKLIESTPDDKISDQDYIEIIKTIEVDFLKATEKNIRMNVLADFRKNFKMKSQDYSQSNRIAELYNEYLYQSVFDTPSNPVQMQELKIHPFDSDKLYPDGFHPNKNNDSRNAKVPILVLNATTLNGGRNWQFTARTMGEPPTVTPLKTLKIDKKPIRLRRATGKEGYQAMVEEQQNFALGHAVAASACVPALFDPLAINNLYFDKQAKEKIVPQLVDGGVFDNQGTDSLLKYSCTRFIVSDASGQMGMENQVASNAVSVLLRVTSVLQDRTRTEGLLHLVASKKEKNIAFMDLRKGLGIREISWNSERDKAAEADKVTPPSSNKFKVNPAVQEKLSFMRTDLDAFTEVEAYSLMLDGYQMSEKELTAFKKPQNINKEQWQFKQISPWMENPELDPAYLKQLHVSQSVFGKSLQAFPWLWTPVIIIFGLLLYYFRLPIIDFILNGSIPIYLIVLTFAVWLMNLIAPKLAKMYSIFKFLNNPYVLIGKRFFKASLLVLATGFIQFYLKFINPMYLAQGRVSKLKQ